MTIEFKSRIKSPFISIPVEIEKMELDVYARAVYQRISYRAGGNSSHFESQENMAKALFISTRQVIRKIQELEKRGMIEVDRRAKSKMGHFLTNIIILEEPSKWVYPHHVTVSHMAMCTTVTPPCDSQSHITRSQEELDPKCNLNAVVEKIPAAVKIEKLKQEKKPPRKHVPKIKSSWGDRSEIDKMESVLHKSMNAHREAVKRGKAALYFFDDFPEVLRPIIEEHGVEKVNSFYDWIKGGVDIRRLDWALHRFEHQQKPLD